MTTEGPEVPAPEPPAEPAVLTTEAEPRKPAATNLTSERIREHLEFVLRVGVMLAALAYFAGLLVVLRHHATYGIFDMDLLRPRVVSAGVVFLLMLALSLLSIAPFLRAWPTNTLPQADTWARAVLDISVYAVSVAFLAFFLAGLFLESSLRSEASPLLFLGAALIQVLSVGAGIALGLKFPKVRWMGLLLVVLSFVGFGWVIYTTWPRAHLQLLGWVAVSGLLTVGARETLAPKDAPWPSWPYLQILLAASGITLGYVGLVHGNVSPSWGGGHPRPVTLYLQTEQPYIEGTEADVLLIDETSRGFYVTREGTKDEALFIPRELVIGVRHTRSLPPWQREQSTGTPEPTIGPVPEAESPPVVSPDRSGQGAE